MSSTRIALVTGANKGIGFAIVRALCRHLKDQGIVYLTARDEKLGLAAVKKLEEEGCHAKFLRVDITDVKSLEEARDLIKKEHGGLDILINNAGIAFKRAATESFAEQAEKTCAVNYFGTVNACHILYPILRPHARVVHVSSRAGDLDKFTNSVLRNQVCSEDLTEPELTKIMEDFVSAAKRGTHMDVGFPNTSYGMSKIGMTALTAVHQRQFDQLGTDIVVNACCPGYVQTDMSSNTGPKTPDEGADTPVYLALLPEQKDGSNSQAIPRGKFVCEHNEVDFAKGYADHQL